MGKKYSGGRKQHRSRSSGRSNVRGGLYKMARLMGDLNAIFSGNIGKRIARKGAGRIFGGFMRKF